MQQRSGARPKAQKKLLTYFLGERERETESEETDSQPRTPDLGTRPTTHTHTTPGFPTWEIKGLLDNIRD